ncbi:phosphoesterase RecJ domain-containing protein [Marinitoga hydrogenitolerans DSM 16785]|uniref:Phosphoesterase RecJ domain-containing protein n=1 Tax=Marinitoga hydrogenitolerans (strain DSM 16785 / JCM 12826 / AT1271) TaxID=1122195 RepID=A0A1M4SLD2_MARH1|nr:bifunctional oligoribonuclease/PAP phosphatase NrnA [Marinitoga hydrogenitolerans]SHE32995.1 phosphoesterase RecJ domain-containing protein [Marinitoga hydrogenitolerans DSM 16785]
MIRTIESIIGEINKVKNILVVGHIMPDGDDISSVLSLTMGLEKLGKNVRGVIDWEIPGYLEEFPYVKEKIKSYDCIKEFPAELIISVDASSPDRIGRVYDHFKFARSVVIDHHATNTYFGNINWVDKFGATAQMVLRLNKMLEIEYDKDLSTVNLLGIATDTGFFKYSNTDATIFKDVAWLVDKGGDIGFISNMILENKPYEHLMLYKDFLDEMRFDDNIAYSHITLDMLKKYKIPPKDSPSFVGELRSIKGVEVAITFSEAEPNVYHVSMRSKNWFDVSKVAVHFGGGGHPRAAGFSKETSDLKKLEKDVVETIKLLMESYK